MSSSPIRRESPNGSRLGQVQPTGEELADGFILGGLTHRGLAWGPGVDGSSRGGGAKPALRVPSPSLERARGTEGQGDLGDLLWD